MKRTATKDSEIWLYGSGVFYYRKGSIETSLKTKDFKIALIRKKALLLKIDDFGAGGFSLRVIDVKDDYIASRKNELTRGEIRVGTFNEVLYSLEKHLIPYFGKTKLSKINSPLWDKYRAGVSVDVTNHRKTFGHFLKWCKKQGYIKYLPDMDVNPVKRRKRRILTPDEMRSIWLNSKGNLNLFISMALFMGMRRSEIMKLEWSRVDFEKKALFLDKDDTKTKSSRWVSLPEVTLNALSERSHAQRVCGMKTRYVFPNAFDLKRHADVSGLKTAWKTCLKNAGLPGADITWHDLRATCEYYAHKRTDLTSTQIEKFFGANIDVQRKIYVSFDADDVRGVENAQFIQEVTSTMGKTRGEVSESNRKKSLSGGKLG